MNVSAQDEIPSCYPIRASLSALDARIKLPGIYLTQAITSSWNRAPSLHDDIPYSVLIQSEQRNRLIAG